MQRNSAREISLQSLSLRSVMQAGLSKSGNWHSTSLSLETRLVRVHAVLQYAGYTLAVIATKHI